MHPVARALKDSAGLVQLSELIPYMLDRAILKKEYMIIPGRQARILRFFMRLLPAQFFHWYTDRVVRSVIRKNPEAPLR